MRKLRLWEKWYIAFGLFICLPIIPLATNLPLLATVLVPIGAMGALLSLIEAWTSILRKRG